MKIIIFIILSSFLISCSMEPDARKKIKSVPPVSVIKKNKSFKSELSDKVVSSNIKNSSKLYLGVLIQNKSSVIRVCFEHENEQWKVLNITNTHEKPHDPELYKKMNDLMSWYVLFDSKVINKVVSKKSLKSNEKGILIVDEDKNQLPKYDAKGFHDWQGPHLYRPVVVSTQDIANDPEEWKTVKVSNEIKAIIIEHIYNLYKEKKVCDSESFQPIKGKKIDRSKFGIIKAYKNNNNEYLVGSQFTGSDYCDSAPNDVSQSPHWYSYKNNSLTFVGSNLVPVDAGDYNQDGKSEWVFQYEGYNEDGLVLKDDNKLLKCSWGYH